MSTPLPSYPWERIAADLFELKGSNFLLVADYYSRFIEVQKLTTTTSSNIISQLKAIFARFGVPATMITDNGPQFDSHEMKEFAQAYEFQHTTTSPYFPQSNGFVERMVKTVKKLFEHSIDPYKSLLSYRSTPLPWCGHSPAELLMGRRIRTDIPQVKENFIPKWEHIQNFRQLDAKYKKSQKENYDRRHRVRTLPMLPDKQTVWVETRGDQIPGQIQQPASTPRSYVIETPSGELRRNRAHLRVRTDLQPSVDIPTTDTPTAERELSQPFTVYSGPVTRSQTGATLRPPDRLRY